MKIIRVAPATGNPPMIVCTGCGKRAAEAGVALPSSGVEKVYGPDGPAGMIVDEGDAQPLCEDCVTALERDQ